MGDILGVLVLRHFSLLLYWMWFYEIAYIIIPYNNLPSFKLKFDLNNY